MNVRQQEIHGNQVHLNQHLIVCSSFLVLLFAFVLSLFLHIRGGLQFNTNRAMHAAYVDIVNPVGFRDPPWGSPSPPPKPGDPRRGSAAVASPWRS